VRLFCKAQEGTLNCRLKIFSSFRKRWSSTLALMPLKKYKAVQLYFLQALVDLVLTKKIKNENAKI
jgi:hypothetical protein